MTAPRIGAPSAPQPAPIDRAELVDRLMRVEASVKDSLKALDAYGFDFSHAAMRGSLLLILDLIKGIKGTSQ